MDGRADDARQENPPGVVGLRAMGKHREAWHGCGMTKELCRKDLELSKQAKAQIKDEKKQKR